MPQSTQGAQARPAASQEEKAANEEAAANKRRKAKLDERRQELRDELWPNAPSLHFNRKSRRDVGFTTIPRTLSLICTLIAELENSGAADVYVDLWSRAWDDGMVIIGNEAEFALSCGFKKGTRHVRSWQDRMRALERLGFILVKPSPAQHFGHVLLVHPHFVVEKLRENPEYKAKVSKDWLALYEARLREVGAGKVNKAQLDRELANANPTGAEGGQ